MKKAIEKPFKVNHKIYVIMTVASCMGIIGGCYWSDLNQCSNNIIDVIKIFLLDAWPQQLWHGCWKYLMLEKRIKR